MSVSPADYNAQSILIRSRKTLSNAARSLSMERKLPRSMSSLITVT